MLQESDRSVPYRGTGFKEAPLPCLAVSHCYPAFRTLDVVCSQCNLRPPFPTLRHLGSCRPHGNMQSARMHRELEYDAEKFGEAAKATEQGYRPATQAQREMSVRRGRTKGMKG